MQCKICSSNSNKIFEKTILNKYPTNYYQCDNCKFIQTDTPFWLDESYSSAITSLDLGLLSRNLVLKDEVARIIDCCFPDAKTMLDYAGGYGVLVRLMRDNGFNFYRQDPYCENIFAKGFDVTDISIQKFDVVTAFEVFEHFADPIPEIEKIFELSDFVIFSTDLVPEDIKTEDWWYISPEIGQHVAFYSKETMDFLAKKYNKNYYYKEKNIHVLTSKVFNESQIDYLFRAHVPKNRILNKLKRKINYSVSRKTLLWEDYDNIKNKLFSNNT